MQYNTNKNSTQNTIQYSIQYPKYNTKSNAIIQTFIIIESASLKSIGNLMIKDGFKVKDEDIKKR